MSSSTRRWLVGLVTVALMAIGVNVIVDAQSTTAIARRWASGLDAAQKLQAFKNIDSLRREYQRELFRTLDLPTLKAGMIDRVLRAQRNRKWSAPEQAALIQELIEVWDSFVDTADTLTRTPLNLAYYGPRVRALLGPEFEALFTFNNGVLFNPRGSVDDVPEVAQLLPVGVRIRQALADAQTLLADNPDPDGGSGACNCSTVAGSNCYNAGTQGTCETPSGWTCYYQAGLGNCPDPYEPGTQCVYGCSTWGGQGMCDKRCIWPTNE
jgi:hypothetical protein